MKIAAIVITFLVNIVLGIALFFIMLMAMNGYSESDAMYGLITFGVLAFSVSLIMATLAGVATSKLIKREFNPIIGASIAIILFSFVGAFLKAVCCIIGIGISELVRLNF